MLEVERTGITWKGCSPAVLFLGQLCPRLKKDRGFLEHLLCGSWGDGTGSSSAAHRSGCSSRGKISFLFTFTKP